MVKEQVNQSEQAIRHLKHAVSAGKHWYIAVLEAVGLWVTPEEVYQEHHFRYLIAGEAFDWLVLVQRLLLEIEDQFPEEEAEALLFEGVPPRELSAGEFRRLIGATKYRAYLNFFYGVVVEQALHLAVVEEVRKEHRSTGLNGELGVFDEAFMRIYDKNTEILLEKFRSESKRPQGRHLNLNEFKEFTYWLFKYRLKEWDPSRVASDTRKGLETLLRNWEQVNRVRARPFPVYRSVLQKI